MILSPTLSEDFRMQSDRLAISLHLSQNNPLPNSIGLSSPSTISILNIALNNLEAK